MVFAPFSDWVDIDFLAAGPGWGNASDFSFRGLIGGWPWFAARAGLPRYLKK